jgi:hypothetical protein
MSVVAKQNASSLEFRLEISKRISNLRMQFLKRLYDGESIIEGYEKGEVVLHVHWSAGRRFLELQDDIQPLSSGRRERVCGVIASFDSERSVMTMDAKMSMLVWVGNGSEPSRPVNSFVWLQFLNTCCMNIADASEVGFAPSLESRVRILNWELSAVLRSAGIEDGQFVNEVIQSTPKVIDDLPHKNRHVDRNFAFRSHDLKREVSGFNHWPRIDLYSVFGDFVLAVSESDENTFQVDQVFHCPLAPTLSSIERMFHDAVPLITGESLTQSVNMLFGSKDVIEAKPSFT